MVELLLLSRPSRELMLLPPARPAHFTDTLLTASLLLACAGAGTRAHAFTTALSQRKPCEHGTVPGAAQRARAESARCIGTAALESG